MKHFICLLVSLGISSAISAQDKLSLASAIEKGLQNNFDVQIQKLEIDIAEGNNNWGQAGRYPAINLIGNQNNIVTERKPANPFAVPGRSINDNLTGQLDVQFILFDGFTITLSKRRLEQLENLSYGNATLVIENTIQGIILGYYQALLEQQRSSVRKRVLAFSAERYEYVKLRKELGGAISFDVLNEQNNYLTDSSNFLLQDMTYKNAVRRLNLLMNEDISKTYELMDSLEFVDEAYIIEDLREKMTSSNTNLKNQFVNQELLHLATRTAMADRYPTLSLNTGING